MSPTWPLPPRSPKPLTPYQQCSIPTFHHPFPWHHPRRPLRRLRHSRRPTASTPGLPPPLHLPAANDLVRVRSQPHNRLHPERRFLHLWRRLPSFPPVWLAFGVGVTKGVLKFGVAMPFTFHSWNGIRHLVWDSGREISNKAVQVTGWTVVGLTVVSSGILAFYV